MMRGRLWVSVFVTALAVALMATPSYAQRRGGGGRAGGGRSVDRGGVDRGGVSVRVGPGWGWGWGYGRPYYGYGWGPVYYGSYVYDDGYYDGSYGQRGSYVYDEGAGQSYVEGQTNDPYYATEAGYDEDEGQSGNVARVTVRLADPNATLWFNGARMLARGTTRTFTTPPLEPGQDYHYTVKVRSMRDGQAIDLTRVVNVRAGGNINLDLTRRQGRTGQTGTITPPGQYQEERRHIDTDPGRSNRQPPNSIRSRDQRDLDRNRQQPIDNSGPSADDIRRPRNTNPRPGDLNRQSDPNRPTDFVPPANPGSRDTQQRPID